MSARESKPLVMVTTSLRSLRTTLVGKAINDARRTLCMSYGASHPTIASGRVWLATDGGAKIAR